MTLLSARARSRTSVPALLVLVTVLSVWALCTASLALASPSPTELPGFVGQPVSVVTTDGAHTVTAMAQMSRSTATSPGAGEFFGIRFYVTDFAEETVTAQLYRAGVVLPDLTFARAVLDPVSGQSRVETEHAAVADLSAIPFTSEPVDYELVFLDAEGAELTRAQVLAFAFPTMPYRVTLSPVYTGYKARVRISLADDRLFGGPGAGPVAAYVSLFRSGVRVGRYYVDGTRDIPVARNTSLRTYRVTVESAESFYRTTSYSKSFAFPKPSYHLSLSRGVKSGRGYIYVTAKRWNGAPLTYRSVRIYRSGTYIGTAKTDGKGKARLAVSKNRTARTFKAIVAADTTHKKTSVSKSLVFTVKSFDQSGVEMFEAVKSLPASTYRMTVYGDGQLSGWVTGDGVWFNVSGASGASGVFKVTSSGNVDITGISFADQGRVRVVIERWL